ncbi:hypothetical protein ANCDUO_21668, partial [Ancylostoma duodenale]
MRSNRAFAASTLSIVSFWLVEPEEPSGVVARFVDGVTGAGVGPGVTGVPGVSAVVPGVCAAVPGVCAAVPGVCAAVPEVCVDGSPDDPLELGTDTGFISDRCAIAMLKAGILSLRL